MKLYLGPLWKVKKKLNLDEVIKDDIDDRKKSLSDIDETNEKPYLYKKEELNGEGYKQMYKQRIIELISEANGYLYRGDSEKAASKFDTALKLYTFAKVLEGEPGLKNILQEEEARKKEGLEEKVTEEEREIEEAGEEEQKEKKPFFAKIKDYFFKKPAVTLYVNKGFFINKWFGLFVPGAKIANENWKIQGRPGWHIKLPFGKKPAILFGQPGWYDYKPLDTGFTHYVYERNYLDAKEGEKPEKKFMYKVARKMPLKLSKKGKTPEQILDEEIITACGKTHYAELWRKDPIEEGWDIVSQMCEDFSGEHFESTKSLREKFNNGEDGLICLDTTIGSMGGGIYTMKEYVKNAVRAILDWGRAYHLIAEREGGFETMYDVDKEVVPSIFHGKRFGVYNKGGISSFRGRKKIALIDKQLIKTWLHLGRPHYKIDIYDKELARDERFKEMLVMSTPYLNKEDYYHKLRFKFDKDSKPKPYNLISLNGKPGVWAMLSQDVIWKR